MQSIQLHASSGAVQSPSAQACRLGRVQARLGLRLEALGSLDLLTGPTLAIVNSRKPQQVSPQERWVRTTVAAVRQAPGGSVLVSSLGPLAYEIAAWSAVEAGRPLVLVLEEGPPAPGSAAFTEQALHYGPLLQRPETLLLWSPGVPRTERPQLRDRLVEALADTVLAAEVRAEGTWYTLLAARLGQGQPLLVAPHRDKSTAGNLALLEAGAQPWYSRLDLQTGPASKARKSSKPSISSKAQNPLSTDAPLPPRFRTDADGRLLFTEVPFQSDSSRHPVAGTPFQPSSSRHPVAGTPFQPSSSRHPVAGTPFQSDSSGHPVAGTPFHSSSSGETPFQSGASAGALVGQPDPDGWLFHYTRSRVGAWPDQTQSEYLAELTGGDAPAHTGLQALLRLLKARRIRATTRFQRGSLPVVCFTACPPQELLPQVRWSPGQRRWNFEPFALAFRKSYALRKGLQPVLYRPAKDFESLPRDQRFLFQRHEPPDCDWTPEQEWRCPGDFHFQDIPSLDLLALVPDPDSAQRIWSATGIPIALLPQPWPSG